MPPKSKVKKTVSVIENPEEKPAPKKRASRAKKVPSKEELMKTLLDQSDNLKKDIQDYKDDLITLESIPEVTYGRPLKLTLELLKEEIGNLEEDLKLANEQYQELLSVPDPESTEQ